MASEWEETMYTRRFFFFYWAVHSTKYNLYSTGFSAPYTKQVYALAFVLHLYVDPPGLPK